LVDRLISYQRRTDGTVDETDSTDQSHGSEILWYVLLFICLTCFSVPLNDAIFLAGLEVQWVSWRRILSFSGAGLCWLILCLLPKQQHHCTVVC